jgi:hypothetical protein
MRLAALFLLVTLSGCPDGNNATDMSVAIKPIGSPCTSDGPTTSVCGPFPTYFCDSDHPNGYCKTACKKDTDCPMGALCAGAGMVSPGECHKKCTQATKNADCRISEGYICKDMPGDASGDYCDVPEPMGD